MVGSNKYFQKRRSSGTFGENCNNKPLFTPPYKYRKAYPKAQYKTQSYNQFADDGYDENLMCPGTSTGSYF